MQGHPEELVVLNALKQMAEDKHLDFKRTAVVGVQHILAQMVPLASILRASGLGNQRGFIVRKVYSTAQSVVEQLEKDEKDEKVFPCIQLYNTNEEAYREDRNFSELFEGDVRENWDLAESSLLPAINQDEVNTILVLDDGGNAIVEAIRRLNVVYRAIESKNTEALNTDSGKFWKAFLKQKCRLAAVEQTSAGVQKIIDYLRGNEADKLTFPIVLVASCALKYLLETKLIAEHFLEKFDASFGRRIREGSLTDRFPLGVIGLGHIGRILTKELCQKYEKRLSITGYDRDALQEEELLAQGKLVTTSRMAGLPPVFQVISSAKVIMGCTGRDAFEDISDDQLKRFFAALDKDVEFFSISSENVEFRRLILWMKEQGSFNQVGGLLGDLECYSARGRKITVHYRGYPFNFKNVRVVGSSTEFDSASGIDPKRFQFMIGTLYGALLQAQGSAADQFQFERTLSELGMACFFHQFDPRVQRKIIRYAFETGSLKEGEYSKEMLRVLDDAGRMSSVSDYIKRDPVKGWHHTDSRGYGINFKEIVDKYRFCAKELYCSFSGFVEACERGFAGFQFERYGFDFGKSLEARYQGEEAIVHLVPQGSLPIEKIYCHLAIIEEGSQKKREAKLKEMLKTSGQKAATLFSESFDELYAKQNDKLVGIDQLFNPSGGAQRKRVLILGKPGIGKSTFCQYVAYLWARCHREPTSWLARFSYCFRISLRELSQCEDCLSIADVIKKLFFQTDTRVTSQDIWYLFASQAQSILLLLDGFDETVRLAEKSRAKSLLEELMTHPACSVVVTSRPYYLGEKKYDLFFELIGYTADDVEAYVIKYFHDATSPDLASRLLGFIKTQPYLQSMVRTPLMLQLICSVFSKDPSFDLTRLNLAELYYRLYVEILRENMSHRARDWLPPIDPAHLTDGEILTSCEPITAFYEQVSFEALTGQVMISSALFKRILEDMRARSQHSDLDAVRRVLQCAGHNDVEKEIRQIVEETVNREHSMSLLSGGDFQALVQQRLNQGRDILHGLLSSGLLTGIEQDGLDIDKDYYFQHLTFQEYFAARYFARLWLDPSEQPRMKTILSQIKTDLAYEVMWCFVSGLLKGNEEAWLAFIRELQDQSNIPNKFYLLVRCIEEADKAQSESVKDYIEWISRIGKGRCKKVFMRGDKVVSSLLLSPKVLAQTKIIDKIKEYIYSYRSNDNEGDKGCGFESVTFRCLPLIEKLSKVSHEARVLLFDLCEVDNERVRIGALKALRVFVREDVKAKEILENAYSNEGRAGQVATLRGMAKLARDDTRIRDIIFSRCEDESFDVAMVSIYCAAKLARRDERSLLFFLDLCERKMHTSPSGHQGYILTVLGILTRKDKRARELFLAIYEKSWISCCDNQVFELPEQGLRYFYWMEAAKVLGFLATDDLGAYKVLKKLFNHPFYKARMHAIIAFGTFSREDELMRKSLLSCCKSKNRELNMEANIALGELVEHAGDEKSVLLFLTFCKLLPLSCDTGEEEGYEKIICSLGALARKDGGARALFLSWVRDRGTAKGLLYTLLGKLAKIDSEAKKLLFDYCESETTGNSVFNGLDSLREGDGDDIDLKAFHSKYIMRGGTPQRKYLLSNISKSAENDQKARDLFLGYCASLDLDLGCSAVTLLELISQEDERALDILYKFSVSPGYHLQEAAIRVLRELAIGDEEIKRRIIRLEVLQRAEEDSSLREPAEVRGPSRVVIRSVARASFFHVVSQPGSHDPIEPPQKLPRIGRRK